MNREVWRQTEWDISSLIQKIIQKIFMKTFKNTTCLSKHFLTRHSSPNTWFYGHPVLNSLPGILIEFLLSENLLQLVSKDLYNYFIKVWPSVLAGLAHLPAHHWSPGIHPAPGTEGLSRGRDGMILPKLEMRDLKGKSHVKCTRWGTSNKVMLSLK